MSKSSTVQLEADVLTSRGSGTDGRSSLSLGESLQPEVTAKLRHLVDQGKSRAIEWRDGLHRGISEKPFQTVLGAVAVGAVLGLILGLRRR